MWPQVYTSSQAITVFIKLHIFSVSICFLFCSSILAQENKDSTKTIETRAIEILQTKIATGVDRMPDLKDNVIYTGKKSEVIRMDNNHADLSTNNVRQVFAKVPGLSVWENDGSGIQVGVAARGLSPNRSWEFNVRQNGYDISSEAFGYPESYFSPPMEALDRIEVVRGAASLQYGPQFGGLLNYQLKKGHATKPIHFETQQTLGSYGMYNTYNAMGGTYKKINWYSYLHHRSADGWRKNSEYSTWTGFASIGWQVSKRLHISAEYTRMNYRSQQPGGLTDAQFKKDPQQSFRSRNWFGAPWNVGSVNIVYDLNESTQITWKTFGTLSERNSIGFVSAITLKDSINAATGLSNPRQIDRDYYKNVGTELRGSTRFHWLGNEQILAGGFRAYRGNTIRDQLGAGSTGSDFDLSLRSDAFGRSLEFQTTNYAVFAEQMLALGKRWKLVPGVRYEYIENEVQGRISLKPEGKLASQKRNRNVFLFGLGSEFQVNPTMMIYGNYSRSFRPVTFSELTPSGTTEVIDPQLKDAKGFNADIGIRGNVKNYLSFDVGLFYLNYDNRIGVVLQNGSPFKTNIGTSVSQGIESYIEFNPVKCFLKNAMYGSLSVFASNSFIQAKYVKWNNPAIASDQAKKIEDKKVENAPGYIHRFGVTYSLRKISATFQVSAVGEVFTDAANTRIPNAAATIGLLPAYEVMDFSCQYSFFKRYKLKTGVNNLTNTAYSTRRSGGYPGPGLLPANGRTFFLTLGATF